MLTLNDGRKELYQWDMGRKATVNIECDIVHFSSLNYGKAPAVKVKNGTVEIPNELLKLGSNIYAWAFVVDDGGGYTKQEQVLAVNKRPKPSDYVYTETEIVNVEIAVNNALEKAKESGDFKGEKGEKGDKGDNGKDANAQEIISYSNKTFANALKGSKSGGAVAMSDISPLEHTLDVRVSGAIKVKKLGKNLIPFPYKSLRGVLGKGASDTHNGITYTVNDDGSITMNGTATGASIFYLNSSAYSWKLQPGKYALDAVKHNSYYYSISTKDDVTGNTKEISNNYEHKGRAIELANETTISTFRIAIAQGATVNNLTVSPQIELGSVGTEYEPYIEPVEYPVNADGTVDGVTPIYPTTTLMTDTAGAVIDVEYNRDINKAFAELQSIVNTLVGG